MATIIPIGEPVNDAERAVIAYLRDHSPASWTVFHNFEIGQGGEWFEVDLAVLTPDRGRPFPLVSRRPCTVHLSPGEVA
jgi:hypothetical protein